MDVLGKPQNFVAGTWLHKGTSTQHVLVLVAYAVVQLSHKKLWGFPFTRLNPIDKAMGGDLNTVDDALLSSLLPGPVLRRRKTLNPCLNPGKETMGVRVPHHPFVLQLMAEFKGAIALISGYFSEQQSSLSAAVKENRKMYIL